MRDAADTMRRWGDGSVVGNYFGALEGDVGLAVFYKKIIDPRR